MRPRQSGGGLGWGWEPHASDGPPICANTVDAINLHSGKFDLGDETGGQLDPRRPKLVKGHQLPGSAREDAQQLRLLVIERHEIATRGFAQLRVHSHSPTSRFARQTPGSVHYGDLGWKCPRSH
jgi:hypothetical protein